MAAKDELQGNFLWILNTILPLSLQLHLLHTHQYTLHTKKTPAYIAFILVCNLWQGTFLYISIDRYHEFTWLLFDEILMLSLVWPYGTDIQHTVSQCKYCFRGWQPHLNMTCCTCHDSWAAFPVSWVAMWWSLLFWFVLVHLCLFVSNCSFHVSTCFHVCKLFSFLT